MVSQSNHEGRNGSPKQTRPRPARAVADKIAANMRRRRILAAFGLALLLAAYAVYWFALARIVRSDIAAWADQQRAQGFAVAFGEPVMGGFPLAITARMSAPDIVAPGGLWHWQGPDTELRVRPWAPFDFSFSAPGHHRLSVAGGAPREIALDAPVLSLRISLGSDGRMGDLSLAFGDASLADNLAGTAKLASLALKGHLPWPAANSPDLSSLDLTLDAGGVELPASVAAPLGRRIEKLHLICQVMGELPAAAPRESLAAWRDAGGVLQLRESEIDWGPLGARGEATFALDQSMQPLAAGTVRISGLSETLDALSAAGLVEPGNAKLAQMMFGALARPPAEGGKPEVKLPLSIQNGYLNMGPIKLAAIAPIDWSQVP
jgi:hypothetical protein